MSSQTSSDANLVIHFDQACHQETAVLKAVQVLVAVKDRENRISPLHLALLHRAVRSWFPLKLKQKLNMSRSTCVLPSTDVPNG